MKGNVPGSDSISDRVSGAMGAASDKINQEKHEGSAEGMLTRSFLVILAFTNTFHSQQALRLSISPQHLTIMEGIGGQGFWSKTDEG